jgi:hypothetical protein
MLMTRTFHRAHSPVDVTGKVYLTRTDPPADKDGMPLQ